MQALVNVPVLPLYKKEKHCEIIEDEVLYGMPVTVLEEIPNNGRVHIRTWYRYEGYVEKNGLWFGEYEADEKQHLIYIAHSTVDILSVPKMQGVLLMTLPMGCFLRKLAPEDESGWVKVKLLNGMIGYVKGAYVKHYREDLEKDEAIFRQMVVRTAQSYLGTQYRWGGKSSYGIDCSGLCSMAYLLNGVIIFRDSHIEQGFPIHQIAYEKLAIGDLLFFKGHVAMWLGNNKIIHSTAKKGREGVVIDSIDRNNPNARLDLWDIYQMCGSLF